METGSNQEPLQTTAAAARKRSLSVRKTRTLLPDGRALIYYDFSTERANGPLPSPDAPEESPATP